MGPAPPYSFDYAQEARRERLHNQASLVDWLQEDDIYKDFDSIYNSMSRQPARLNSEPGQPRSEAASDWSQSAAFETGLLAKSLADVEEALRRASSSSNGRPPGWSPAEPSPSADPRPLCSRSLQLPAAGLQRQTSSPMWSTAASEQTRADSRNTNQSYQIGPALVEEMTLSDLEEEISSSLMAGSSRPSDYYSRGEQLLKTPRSRQPMPASFSRNPSQPANPLGLFRPTIMASSGYHSDSYQPEGMYNR